MKELAIYVKEDHLCVISDLHLGNPVFDKKDYLRSFLKHIGKKGASLCINGDCFDSLQSTTAKLASDLQSAFRNIKEFLAPGTNKFYYVHGNHDLHWESYLGKSGLGRARPYLDVVSGGRRIHIEHGHLYDRRFQRFPRLHQQIARILGKLLKITPEFFHLFFHLEWWLYGLHKQTRQESALFDVPRNLSAAEALFAKGFDIVILAHSHRHGLHLTADGKVFANAGAWTADRLHYLEINRGAIALKEWRGAGARRAGLAGLANLPGNRF